MSSSVRISDEAKRALERLQAKITIKTGKKVSQQRILEALIKSFEDRENEVIRLLDATRFPLSPEEIEELLRIPVDWGVETEEEDINKALYSRG